MAYHPQFCPNFECKHHKISPPFFLKKSFYKIKRTQQTVRRFQCPHCKITFSSRTFKNNYRHKKMDLNLPLKKLLLEGNSIRACSRILKMTYKNTFNKFLWLMKQAQLEKSKLKMSAQILQFDEMETIEHSKCKPLSIAIMVNEKYQVLSLETAVMPAKGRLARISELKYGKRNDDREIVLKRSFKNIQKILQESPIKIMSDAKPSYRKYVETFFTDVKYETHSRAEKERHRDRLHEKLHKKAFDPLFQLNQRCALLRSQIRRLTRRSWCTTKKVENLQGHLDLFLVEQFNS